MGGRSRHGRRAAPPGRPRNWPTIPRSFDREWNLFALDDSVRDWGTGRRVGLGDGTHDGHGRGALAREGPRLKDPATANRLAARLELALGRFARAEAAARRVLAMPGRAEEEGAKAAPGRARSRGLGRHAEAVEVFREPCSARTRTAAGIRPPELAEALAGSLRRQGEADELLAGVSTPAARSWAGPLRRSAAPRGMRACRGRGRWPAPRQEGDAGQLLVPSLRPLPRGVPAAPGPG